MEWREYLYGMVWAGACAKICKHVMRSLSYLRVSQRRAVGSNRRRAGQQLRPRAGDASLALMEVGSQGLELFAAAPGQEHCRGLYAVERVLGREQVCGE